jgi:hypothetical protein
MSRPRRLAEGEDLWSNTLRRIFNNLRITQGTVDVAWRIPVDPGIPALAKRSSDSDLEQSANTDIMVRRQRSA